jgi:hypothetical protein
MLLHYQQLMLKMLLIILQMPLLFPQVPMLIIDVSQDPQIVPVKEIAQIMYAHVIVVIMVHYVNTLKQISTNKQLYLTPPL